MKRKEKKYKGKKEHLNFVDVDKMERDSRGLRVTTWKIETACQRRCFVDRETIRKIHCS